MQVEWANITDWKCEHARNLVALASLVSWLQCRWKDGIGRMKMVRQHREWMRHT